jgi:hypothetical protein
VEKLGKRVEKKGGKVLEVGVSPSVYIKNWHFSTHIPLPPKKIAKGWKTIFVPLFSKGWKKGGKLKPLYWELDFLISKRVES